MDKNHIVKDKLTKICLCTGVNRFTIKECIKNGINTINNIKKNTGATGGGCKGRRCIDKINELINEYKML